MNALYLLIPIALLFLIVAIRVLVWAIRSGQYDDLDTEGKRILFDDEDKLSPSSDDSDKGLSKDKCD